MLQPERNFNASGGLDYRYGFNGKESDNEIKGEGNQQDYGMRIYDPRLGRFLSTDPITRSYPSLTPYQFASNSPVKCIDLDGLEGDPVQDFIDILNGVRDDLTSKKRWDEAAKNVNETINPLYFIPNHVSKIFRGKDLEGNPVDYRGTKGAVSDAGVDIMGYLTGEKFFKAFSGYGANALEAELNNASRTVSKSSTSSKSPENKPILESPDDISNIQKESAKQEKALGIKKSNPPTIQQKGTTSIQSQAIVRNRLESQLGTDEIIIDNPRFYIGDGKNKKLYSVPDFAVYNTKRNQFVKIVDAKNGGGDFTKPQKMLNEKGGVFNGSSRYPEVQTQAVRPGMLTAEKTNLSYQP